MAFPVSPVNGQTTTINGITHVYSSASNSWTRAVAVNSYTSATAPTNPNIGDIWYDTVTDDVFRYTTDGVGFYWLDITGPTVANAVTYQSINVYANSFNGSSQYLSTPSNAAFSFGTGDFTIEAWINRSGGSGNQPIGQSDAIGGSTNDKWWFGIAGTGLFLGTHSTGGFSVNTTNTFNLNTWYHVAVTRASGVIYMFVNGVSTAFTTSGTPSGYSLSQNGITIGAMSTPIYWTGSISNLRLTKGTALYTATFTVPIAPLTAITNTSLLTCQTIPPADASTNKFAVTSVNGVGLSILSAQQSAAVVGPIILPDSTQFITANSLGMRNRIINGAMIIDQRNNGLSQTITAAAALAYTVDRWYAYSTGANVTGQQVAGVDKVRFVYQFTGAASVTAIGFAQRIELQNSYDFNNSTVTLSAFLSNSLLTTVTWTAYYANTANTFGTLAAPTKTQIATGSWTVTSTLARYATNITIPAAATTGIEIVFTVGAQTSGTWQIGPVQLEAGSVATPFEYRPVGMEQQLCYRYFQVINSFFGYAKGSQYNTDGFMMILQYATKRALPTVTTNQTGVSQPRTAQVDQVILTRTTAIDGGIISIAAEL